MTQIQSPYHRPPLSPSSANNNSYNFNMNSTNFNNNGQ